MREIKAEVMKELTAVNEKITAINQIQGQGQKRIQEVKREIEEVRLKGSEQTT